jgi:hypothetical protein
LCKGDAHPLADGDDAAAADLHPQKQPQQRLALADTQREGTAQQTHQAAEPGPVAAALHISCHLKGLGWRTCLDTELVCTLDFQWHPRNQITKQNSEITGIKLASKRRVKLFDLKLTGTLYGTSKNQNAA